MTGSTKTYGCVVYRSLPGHIRVKSRSITAKGGDKYLSTKLDAVKPNPSDYHQHGRFIQYNGIVYYIAMSHRVYETNIEPGRTVRFDNRYVAYMTVDDYRMVPVTLRKLDKVEWLFL